MLDSIRMHRYLNVALPIGLLTLIGVALFSSWSIYQLREGIRYERQSNFIKENVHTVYELIQGAESSQRGYLLTGKTEYLATYMTSFPEIPKAVDQLKRSVVFLPEHEAPIKELDELLEKKLDELKLTVVLQQNERQDDALAMIQTDRGEALMNRIHAVLDGIDRDARREALVHQTFVRRYSSVLNLTIGLGTATTIALVLLFAFFTRDEIKRRTRTEHELRTAQDAALIASKLKSQFLATVSHEIRTPLNGIIGMSDLLRARVRDPEHRRFVDIIHNSGNALLKIVNDILDFSKIEAGRINFEFSEFSLLDSVEATVDLYSAQAREKRISLVCYVDPNMPARVVGDTSRLSQVLRNLISNALKFTEEGGVSIRARLVAGSNEKSIIRFEVTDTGRGIAAEHHKLLFQPFNQVTEGGRKEGTGLGLSICKDIVEAMGGSVGFDSSLGKGSMFWFQVPVKPVSDVTVGASQPISVQPLSVFFVGVDAVVSRVLQYYGSEWGAQLVEIPSWSANDGGTLISNSLDGAKSNSGKPVIFVAVERVLDDALVDDLTKIASERKARVVFVSQDGLEELSPAIRNIEAEGFLGEPFRREQLASILNGTSNFIPLSTAPSRPEKQDSALILLVEDNQTNQLLAELLLQELGHRVHTVANGREAVEALTRISYDLVLMDCQMPVMDGFEATRLIRARELTTGQHTPIVAMTANALEGDRERCFQAGMDDFLAKPFQASELSDRLRRWVKAEARGTVDWAILHDLATKTNSTVVTRLIQSFLKTLPLSLGEIKTALDSGDHESLRAWAHQLKSSSASLGATELNKLCLRLEEAVETKSSSDVIAAAARDLLVDGETALAEFKAQTRYV
jgi:two-component system sensor histidine kinase/response regulator